MRALCAERCEAPRGTAILKAKMSAQLFVPYRYCLRPREQAAERMVRLSRARRRLILNLCVLLHHFVFFLRELVARPRKGNVQRGQQEQADHQRQRESAHNHDGEWPLRVRPDGV